MKTILLTNDIAEAESFCRSAGIDEDETMVPQTGADARCLHFKPNDLILQFYSFRDHPEREAIEGEILVALAHFGKGPKPRWVRAGQ